MRTARLDPGFTLIEVMAALVIGGIAVTAAAGLFNALSTQAEAVRALGVENDTRANGERLIRGLFENLEFRSSTSPALSGTESSVVLSTWCDGVDGWLVPCSARIAFERGTRSVALNIEVPNHRTEWRRGGHGELRYLVDPAHGGTWTTTWTNRVPPKAVAIIIDRDTLMVGVGGNG